VCLVPTSQPERFSVALNGCNKIGYSSFYKIIPGASNSVYQLDTFVPFHDAYYKDGGHILSIISKDLGHLGQTWLDIKTCIRNTMQQEMSGGMYKDICT